MWSYSGDPSNSPKDAVRCLIGDTNQRQQLLQDGEINWILGKYGEHSLNAAVQCCELIIAKFARMADESIGPVSISYSQKSDNVRKLQGDLRMRLAIEDIAPYAGGISVSDKQTQEFDTDRVRPDFSKHMMDNPQAPWVSSGLADELWWWA